MLRRVAVLLRSGPVRQEGEARVDTARPAVVGRVGGGGEDPHLRRAEEERRLPRHLSVPGRREFIMQPLQSSLVWSGLYVTPVATGCQEAGFTQPMARSTAHP